MNAPHFSYRSEAFAEDIEGLLATWEPVAPERPRRRLLVNLLPLLVAMVGVAFALVPPLA